MPSGIAGRVHQLIAQSHAGSVNAAARWMGLPQSTLSRIVTGKATNPRTRTLDIIARAYGVPIDRLVGESSTTEEARTFGGLVSKLGLKRRDLRALRALIEAPDTAAAILLNHALKPEHQRFARTIEAAWLDLLYAAIRLKGSRRLKDRVREFAQYFALGGSEYAGYLLKERSVRLEIEQYLVRAAVVDPPRNPFAVRAVPPPTSTRAKS
jgi:transcriptional regulator with XRE-family HTH domain